MLQRTIDRRRYSRVKAAWPVAVFTKERIFSGLTTDIGPLGAKVQLDGPLLEEWKLVRVRVCPPDEAAFDAMALVWRVDPSGVTLFFFQEWGHGAPEESVGERRAVA